MHTAPIHLKLREQRVRWYGQVSNHPIRKVMEFEARRKEPMTTRSTGEEVANRDRGLRRRTWRRLTKPGFE
ncbi:unnamed protein product [Haemonchus placei]|uniref:Transposase n=1 Tax=Haemonchus placei TaxID=6290 RepID=A0A0N4X617_HAEPC|nr:unnamed protein product [Haemonchus placei]